MDRLQSPRGYVAVVGSERALPAGARLVGPVPADERVEATIVLRPPRARPGSEEIGAQPAPGRTYLSREELAAAVGADPDELARVEEFVRSAGLELVGVDAARRSLFVAGSAAAIGSAFAVELGRYEQAGERFRGRSGPVHVPAALAPFVQAVLGVDDRPQARTQFRRLAGPSAAAAQAAQSYTPLDLARLYRFPDGLDGEGETIGFVELGGGYREADLETYFAALGLRLPNVVVVPVDGGSNSPGGQADAEVMLDLEVAGALAPAASLVVYFAPNTDRGFFDAVTAAIHDSVSRPSLLSISWGGPESSWTGQALTAFDQALQDAALAGMTVLCAAGDSGSSDGVGDGLAHVDFPAASPHALACGGSRLESSGDTIESEVAWNEPGDGATGGGVSAVFALPDWQQAARVPPSANPDGAPGRGVPDVAADADPLTGYQVRVDGQDEVIGGTSAVAPFYAGLIARLNQRLGMPIGYLNPLLYSQQPASGVFRDIAEGSNGAYQAGPGWDACTGLGSIDGNALLDALSA